MQTMKTVVLVIFLTVSVSVYAQDMIPPGIVLPVQLDSSFSTRTHPGTQITATIMQNVAVQAGTTIRKGAKVIGHVIAVTPGVGGANSRLSFIFDKVVLPTRTILITTNLRALASFVEVEAAQIPDTGPDRGTPESAWTTVLIGGDVNYRGGGPVKEGSRTVGRPVPDGVLSQVISNSIGNCRGVIDGNDIPQALWVFSSDACGLYGFQNITIAHAGRSDPIGQIVLISKGGSLNVQSGSGMLLRITSSTEKTT